MRHNYTFLNLKLIIIQVITVNMSELYFSLIDSTPYVFPEIEYVNGKCTRINKIGNGYF